MSKKVKPIVSDVLCIGPKASGKTMLLRKLEDPTSEVSAIPTVGVNHAEVSLENRTVSQPLLSVSKFLTYNQYFAGIF
jgi:hypothetical protein